MLTEPVLLSNNNSHIIMETYSDSFEPLWAPKVSVSEHINKYIHLETPSITEIRGAAGDN